MHPSNLQNQENFHGEYLAKEEWKQEAGKIEAIALVTT